MASGWIAVGVGLLLLRGRRRRGVAANDSLSSGDGPFRLVEMSGVGNPVVLRNDAAEALLRMIAAARQDGIPEPWLLPFDGYRTEEEQRRRHEGKSSTWVAHADSSEHRTGRGVDLWLGEGSAHTAPEIIAALRKTPAWRWLDKNAERFGFFPYRAEPWHFAYGQRHITNRAVLRAEIQRGREEGYLT